MYPVHPTLRDRVVSVEVVEQRDAAITVLPTVGAVMGLQHRGRIRAGAELLSTAGVTGIQSGPRDYAYLGATGSILVRFTPQGASCLGVPACELAGRNVALDDILRPARARETRERFLDARSDAARIAVIEDMLRALPFTRDPLVERAIALLSDAGHHASVAAVARALSVSERQLERRFLRRVGIGPKRFAQLRRFERATALMGTQPSLTRAALAAGYYDQAHFIREFRRFAGVTPGAFARSRR